MSTAYAEDQQQATETVVLDQHRPPAIVQPQARDNVSALLPVAPKGREFGRLADMAKRIGERLGAIVTGEGSSKAIYSFPVGQGSRVEGPTVWLIGALWQEYGHVVVDSEIREERGGRVAITTTIVDRINGTAYRREHHTALSPAPAKFARKPDQAERWYTMQLQSAISKAERTTVQHFLPGWYVDIAVESAKEAFGKNVLGKHPNGNPMTLAEAIDASLRMLERDFKVSQAMIEELIDAERPLWTISDFAEVRALYKKLQTGAATVAGVFGTEGPPKPAATTTATAAPAKSEGLGGLVDDAAEPKPNSPADAGHTKPAEAAPRKAPPKKAPAAAAATTTATAAPAPVDPPKTMSPEELAASSSGPTSST